MSKCVCGRFSIPFFSVRIFARNFSEFYLTFVRPHWKKCISKTILAWNAFWTFLKPNKCPNRFFFHESLVESFLGVRYPPTIMEYFCWKRIHSLTIASASEASTCYPISDGEYALKFFEAKSQKWFPCWNPAVEHRSNKDAERRSPEDVVGMRRFKECFQGTRL